MSGAPWANRPQNIHQKWPCNTHTWDTHTNWPDELVSGEPQSTSHITRVLHTFPMRTSLHVMILCDTTPSSTCINYIIQRHCDCVTWNCNRKAYKYVLFISNGALVAWQSWWGKRWKFQTSLHPSVPATSFFSLVVFALLVRLGCSAGIGWHASVEINIISCFYYFSVFRIIFLVVSDLSNYICITFIWRIKSPSRRTDIKHSNECVRFVVRRCQYSSYLCCKLEAWIVAIANSLDDILPLDLELNASLRSNIIFSRIGLAFTIFYLTCCTYFMDIV